MATGKTGDGRRIATRLSFSPWALLIFIAKAFKPLTIMRGHHWRPREANIFHVLVTVFGRDIYQMLTLAFLIKQMFMKNY